MGNIYDKEIIENFKNGKKGDKIGVKCSKCGKEMIIREGYSKFLGCTGYPKCTNKYVLSNEDNNMNINPRITSTMFEDVVVNFGSNIDTVESNWEEDKMFFSDPILNR